MPVTIMLKDLVSVPGCEKFFPEKFAGLVAAVEELPNDTNRIKVLRDWCEESGEDELAVACKWLANRPELYVTVFWKRFDGPPAWRVEKSAIRKRLWGKSP
jgi:hypothetical protein